MKITLLITTFNRSSQLNITLQRLKHLTLPDEIIVVDDGSSDNTEAVVREFTTELPIRYIYNHNPDWSICSMARNIGVKQAIGDIIITSEPELLWVSDVIPQMMKSRQEHPQEIISAGTIFFEQTLTPKHPLLIVDPRAALKDAIVENYETQPRSYRQDGYVKTINMQATFCALYEKSWLMEVGGWDEEFPGAWGFDDIDLCTRLRINGINQYIDWGIECVHQFHPHLPPHLQGKAMFANEKHMQDKNLNEAKKGDQSLIANKGKEWGVVKTRI